MSVLPTYLCSVVEKAMGEELEVQGAHLGALIVTVQLVVSAEWAWSCPECGLSNFPVPSRGSGVLQVMGTM